MDATVKINKTMVVSGKGESKAAAFAEALSTIQKNVVKETSDVILRIEPKAVTVLSAEEQSYTERFLFFFMPRTRNVYQVKLQVETDIMMIKMDQVEFVERHQQSPDAIHIPFLSKKV